MMSESTVLLDTNILLYAHTRLVPFHEQAKKLLERALAREIQACVSLQNLAEFFSVITDSRRVSTPLSSVQAYSAVEEYVKYPSINKIIENEGTLEILLTLIKRYKPKCQAVHDLKLVALMLSCNVRIIYTADKGFEKFKEIKAVNPFE